MTAIAIDPCKRLDALERRQAYLDRQRDRLEFLRAKAVSDAERIRAKEERERAEAAQKREVFDLLEKMAAEQGRPSPSVEVRIAQLEHDAKRDPRINHGLHLLDLKRAGHSPTRTELNIPSDDCAVAFRVASRVVERSVIGSPAAWSTEW